MALSGCLHNDDDNKGTTINGINGGSRLSVFGGDCDALKWGPQRDRNHHSQFFQRYGGQWISIVF
jgi:hypothetical protein